MGTDPSNTGGPSGPAARSRPSRAAFHKKIQAWNNVFKSGGTAMLVEKSVSPSKHDSEIHSKTKIPNRRNDLFDDDIES